MTNVNPGEWNEERIFPMVTRWYSEIIRELLCWYWTYDSLPMTSSDAQAPCYRRLVGARTWSMISMVSWGYLERIWVLLFRSQTYDLPITTSDSSPLGYRRLVGATITGKSLGTLTLLGWFSYLRFNKHENELTRLKSPVQARKWSRPGNDPWTRNDPQIGQQMIPGPEMISKLDRQMIPDRKWLRHQ